MRRALVMLCTAFAILAVAWCLGALLGGCTTSEFVIPRAITGDEDAIEPDMAEPDMVYGCCRNSNLPCFSPTCPNP